MRHTRGFRLSIVAVLAAVVAWPAAASAQGPSDGCPNAAVRGVVLLPDCRAFEQVTPVDKRGKHVSDNPIVPAAAGGAVLSRADGAIVASDSTPYSPSFVSTRGADGWSTRSSDPLQASVPVVDVAALTLAYSSDGTAAFVWSESALTAGAVDGAANFYVRDLRQRSSFRFVATAPYYSGDPRVLGTPDFSSLVLQFPQPLAADDPGFGPTLYHWTDGDLRRIENLSDPDTGESPPDFDANNRTLSSDGTRVTYATGAGRVYQWVDGQRRLVSHLADATRTPANGSSPVASSDGKEVTFVSTQALTPTSRAGTASVYRWDADTDTITDLLAPLRADGDRPFPSIRIRDVSPDGQLIWIVVSDPDGDASSNGVFQIDNRSPIFFQIVGYGPGADPAMSFSPDGKTVALSGPFDQSGFPTRFVGCSVADCPSQLVTFQTDIDGTALCRTCGKLPAGAVGLGRSPGATLAQAVLDDGRVFFDTTAQLVSSDVNGSADVYAFSNRGGVVPVTAGTGSQPAFFGGFGDDGTDLFLATARRLVPADVDDEVDVYDARVGGGFASQQTRPADTPRCVGDACKAAPASAPPAVTAPASVQAAPRPTTLPAFSVAAPSQTALRKAARTGRLELSVRTGAPGTVSAGLRARVGGRTRDVGSATVKRTRAQTATIGVRLSAAARRTLARKRRLELSLTVAYSQRTERVRRTLTLTARRATTKQKGGRR